MQVYQVAKFYKCNKIFQRSSQIQKLWMTQKNWKILITKSIDDAMHHYFQPKKWQKWGQIPVLGKITHM